MAAASYDTIDELLAFEMARQRGAKAGYGDEYQSWSRAPLGDHNESRGPASGTPRRASRNDVPSTRAEKR